MKGGFLYYPLLLYKLGVIGSHIERHLFNTLRMAWPCCSTL